MKSVENEWEQTAMKNNAAAPIAAKSNSTMTESTVNVWG
jgi:hypothetical protein